MKELLRKNTTFLIPVLIFIIAGIVFLSLSSKEEIHLWINQWHSSAADLFFVYITFLGDGMIYPAVALLLAFLSWRYFLGFTIDSVLALIIVGLLKNFIYTDVPRPIAHFEEKEILRLVDDVEVFNNNSFPSGHTTFAFACWGFLAFISRSRGVKFALFGLAVFIGYSRMYLSQHFLPDVIAGAFLGTVFALTGAWIMHKLHYSWLNKRLRIKTRR